MEFGEAKLKQASRSFASWLQTNKEIGNFSLLSLLYLIKKKERLIKKKERKMRAAY